MPDSHLQASGSGPSGGPDAKRRRVEVVPGAPVVKKSHKSKAEQLAKQLGRPIPKPVPKNKNKAGAGKAGSKLKLKPGAKGKAGAATAKPGKPGPKPGTKPGPKPKPGGGGVGQTGQTGQTGTQGQAGAQSRGRGSKGAEAGGQDQEQAHSQHHARRQPAKGYNDFDIVLEHLSRGVQPRPAPHAPFAVIVAASVVIGVLIGAWNPML